MTRRVKPLKSVILLLLLTFVSACSNQDWRTASREAAGIAPDPGIEKAAVIEFYAADAFSWRGWFAVHTWVATKAENDAEYTMMPDWRATGCMAGGRTSAAPPRRPHLAGRT